MDPLSVGASIIAVIQITTTVSKSCMAYIRSAKNVEGELLRLVREIGGLRIVLHTLKSVLKRAKQLPKEHIQVEDGDTSDDSILQRDDNGQEVEDPYLLPTLRRMCELKSVFDECRDKLKKLADDIKPPKAFQHRTKTETLIRALKWPMKESSMRSILEDINNYITLFSLALSFDTADAVLDIHKLTRDTYQSVQSIKDVQEEEGKRRHAEDIIQWLAAPDYSSDYTHALHKRAKNTGSWLLNRSQYIDWKSATRSLLWLYGTVGCGKTILSSNVVEDLSRQSENDQDMAVAYFYFKMDDGSKRDPTNMLRSVIKQLFESSKSHSDALESLYEQQKTQSSTTDTELLSVLRAMASTFDNVYVILDALDECRDRSTLFDHLEEMGQWQDINIHLLLTSRDERDIAEAIEGVQIEQHWLKLTAAILKEDIRNFISSRLQTDREFKRWKKQPQVQKEIEESLTKKSEGMFQWVVCQLEALMKCNSPPKLRKALNSLPETLYETYAAMLSKIEPDDHEVASRIFHWLLFSNRPLSIEELAELAAIDFGDDNPTIERFYDSAEVLKICPGFFTEVEESGTNTNPDETKTLIRIAHISIREYLLSSEIGNSKVSQYRVTEAQAHSVITENCLLYMQLVDQPFEPPALEEFPLALYVIGNWLLHYEKVPESDERLHTYVCEFLRNHSDVYQKWADHYFPDTLIGFKDELRPYVLKSPVNTAAAYGLIPLLKAMFGSNYIDTKNKNCLQEALRASNLSGTFPRPPRSNLEVTKFLVEHGADFTGDDRWRSTLHAASYYGLYELVKAEIEEGAESDSQKDKYTSALYVAVAGRHTLNFLAGGRDLGKYLEKIQPSCIELLLENGANPEGLEEMSSSTLSSSSSKGVFLSALSSSCSKGDIVVAKLLLAHGANPNFEIPKSSGIRLTRSCLSEACSSRDIRIVKLLFDHGADINSSGALTNACRVAQPDIVRLLLERGANPNGTDEGEIPLQYACASGCETSVDLLLQHGADVHLGGGHFGSPLNEAAFNGFLSIVKKLIGKGADVNLKAGFHGTALQAAANSSKVDVIEYLLKNGADVNLHTGFFSTALQAVFMWPHPDIFILLLKNGADLAVKSPYGSTFTEALSRAPQDLSEVYTEQYFSKLSSSTWRAVKKPVTASFTDYDKLEILELNSPKDKTDPAFLCSFEPL